MKKSARPSEGSPDDLCIVGVAIQHQKNEEKTDIFSFSYCTRSKGKSHSGLHRLKTPPKLPHVIGWGLEGAKLAGVFNHYPREIFLAVHDTGPFLDLLADGDRWTDEFETVKSSPASRSKPVEVSLTDRNNNSRKVWVWLVDTRLLGPDRETLPEVGEWLGLTCPGIPESGRWGALHSSPGAAFEDNATLAAEITADLASGVASFTGKLTGTFTIRSTLGSLAEDFFIKGISDVDKLLGKEQVNRRTRRRKLKQELHLKQTLATECYHGGRNESFYYGITDDADWRDDDLCAAYPTILSGLGLPLWGEMYESKDPDDFDGDVIGMAWIDFQFPSEVRFPTIPVRVDEKLIFPQRGSSYATAAEICLARRLGARVQIKEGVVIPQDLSQRPFASPLAELQKIRDDLSSTNLDRKFAKRCANSIPGKMGQGLGAKHSSLEYYNEVQPCRITQPFLAAHINGMARAIIGEILNNLPLEVRILAVTTDGFISDANSTGIEKAVQGKLCRQMAQDRLLLTGSSEILSTKRRARRLLCGRNRIVATLETCRGWPPIVSRSGIVTPPEADTKENRNEWLVGQILDRRPETSLRQKSFERSQGTRRVRLDYDFDRQPHSPRSRTFNRKEHISFTTLPWEEVKDYQAAAEALDIFQKIPRCLTTMADLEDLMELIEANRSAARNPSVKRTTTISGPLKTAKRHFLRALRRKQCGLHAAMSNLTHRQVADKINQVLKQSSIAGMIEIKPSDLKNARFSNPLSRDQYVPQTPRTILFMELMRKEFTGFDPTDLFTKKKK